MGAEAGGVEEGGRFGHAAAVAERLEVADMGAGIPGATGVVDELVGAELT